MYPDLVHALLVPLSIYAVAVPTPGPGFAMIARASLGSGRRAGMAAALGTTLGAAAYAAATILGISALITALPWLLTAIQLVGGTYLVYLGVQALRSAFSGEAYISAPESTACSLPSSNDLMKVFAKALFVCLGNPKVAAFFFGLFATLADAAHLMSARVCLLIGVVMIDFVYHQVLANVLALDGARRTMQRIGRKLDAAVGTLLTVFGTKLITEAIKSR